MILPISKIAGEGKTPPGALRQTSIDVTEFGQELHAVVESLIETLLFYHSVGLSAPQIGSNLNIFVMGTGAGSPNRRAVRVIINPKTLTEAGEDAGTPNERLETCLSVPGVLGLVTRCHEVDFVYWDESGKRHRASLSGGEARIYQHEADHLRGVLFVDKAKAFYPVGHHFVETHQMLRAAGRD
jgi:peptide deformylase